MLPKLMDMDRDWESIIENELAFLTDQKMSFGLDFRYTSSEQEEEKQPATEKPAEDGREAILRALVSIASFN